MTEVGFSFSRVYRLSSKQLIASSVIPAGGRYIVPIIIRLCFGGSNISHKISILDDMVFALDNSVIYGAHLNFM